MSEFNYWSELFKSKQISRREFLGRTAMLASAAAVGTSGLPHLALAEEPKKGGMARFGLSDGSQTDSLNPAAWPASFAQTAFNGALYNNLTEMAADGSVVGDLAENFEPSDGAKKWVFRLRQDVTYHDGKPLTVEDVQESFWHHMGEDSRSAAKTLLSQVESIEKDGDRNVVFTLKSGIADFPYIVADYHMSIVQAKPEGGIDWEKGVGTGSFVLENFDPGISVKMTRNPDYHKENKPYLDEFELLVIHDSTARINALITGEVDFIDDLDPRNMSLVERNPDLKVEKVQSLVYDTFDMNTTVAPFDNVDVRLALKYAMDREDILRKVYLGVGSVGNDTPVAPATPFYRNPTPGHEYNIEKAKEHLKKAGLTSLDIDLSVAESAFRGAVESAVLYKEHAAKAGININVIRESDDGFWENVWLKKPFTAMNGNGRPTCDWLFSLVMAPDAPWNGTRWQHPRFTELLIAARSETDQAKRAEQYAEMQQLVHDYGGMVTVAFRDRVYGISNKIGHGTIGGLLANDNLRMSERWWLK